LLTVLNLVHADETIVVVDKPAGLLAVPGRGEAGLDHLALRVQRQFADARVVHRLDMATSGLMLFARGDGVQRQLNRAFAQRLVHKRYVAVVHGQVPADAGTIDAPLAADWPNRPRQQVDRLRGKPSLTRWRVLARDDATTRLELEPVTGRSHQLRVHLLSIGHPICGDLLYGPPVPTAPVEPGPHAVERLLLHACALSFAHPLHGEDIQFASEPPF
jgi:tRNA pseudouridine32 synthase/23S rRNA pseudouridine746 synthase